MTEDEELEELPELPELPKPPPPPNPALHKGYPVGLALELALKVADPVEVLKAYNIDGTEWARIRRIPAFQKEYRELVEKSKESGFSYQMKAAAQAEGLLKTTWDLIQDADTPASVRADMIKFTARVAGYDQKDINRPMFAPGGDGTGGITITINLGEEDEKDVKTITTGATIDQPKHDDS